MAVVFRWPNRYWYGDWVAGLVVLVFGGHGMGCGLLVCWWFLSWWGVCDGGVVVVAALLGCVVVVAASGYVWLWLWLMIEVVEVGDV